MRREIVDAEGPTLLSTPVLQLCAEPDALMEKPG